MKMSPISMIGSRTPMLRKSVPNSSVVKLCRKNKSPPVASSWLIGAARSTGAMMSTCTSSPSTATPMMATSDAAPRAEDGAQQRGPQRPAEHVQPIDRVHAAHDEVGVGDPHHVDHAEDEVEAEREQREHAAEQEPVDHRLDQINVEHRRPLMGA